MGFALPTVQHYSYVWRQANRHAYGHHRLAAGTPPGIYRCGVCDRFVIRGVGRWWSWGWTPEAGDKVSTPA